MAKDLRSFLGQLKAAGELLEIEEELGITFEIPAAIREIDKRVGKAAYFSRPKGHHQKVRCEPQKCNQA